MLLESLPGWGQAEKPEHGGGPDLPAALGRGLALEDLSCDAGWGVVFL